jgi:hypothetical protein
MSLYWTIESKTQRVTLAAEGEVSRGDVEAYLNVVIGAKARSYAKLVDWRAAALPKDMEEAVALGADLRSRPDHPVGPLAIVLTAEQRESPLVARFLGILATVSRPMRLFSDPAAAHRWLDGAPPGA